MATELEYARLVADRERLIKENERLESENRQLASRLEAAKEQEVDMVREVRDDQHENRPTR